MISDSEPLLNYPFKSLKIQAGIITPFEMAGFFTGIMDLISIDILGDI